MEFKIGNIFGNKKQEPKQQTAVEKNIGEQGGISAEQFKIEQQKEKVMKMIEKDAKLKRAYDFWFNKTDKTGKNMQDKLVEFLMENPKADLGYDKTTQEFADAKMKGAGSSIS